ncbi:MAG: formate C-acetyltransferase/glycerol dehydratase family glycyl radical enzyme [Promethearchaeota archaeon]|nr:MAG: formate C-acetyltransferase/glycerol dehydratase family glycyl radical enzyme [Candidatus Lokiarchaeota archaeon]
MIVNLLQDLVRKTPTLSLIVPLSYMKALEEKPAVSELIKQAKGLKYTLENLPILIRPDETIVGTFDVIIPVAIPRPEATGLRIMRELDSISTRKVNPIKIHDKDTILLKEKIAPFYENNRVQVYADEIAPKNVFDVLYRGIAYVSTEGGGIAHAVIDYERLLEKGLKYYLDHSKEKISEFLKVLGIDPRADEKIAFYKSMKILIEALIEFANKYSNKAFELSKNESDPYRRTELLKIAESCKHVPENPPRDLHEAIQFIWFIHLALHLENFEHGISFGRIDQYLLKYYNGDKNEAVRLFRNLILKTNEIVALYDSIATQYFGGMATTQGVVIGGVDINGNDATNDLTYLFLSAHKNAAVPSPNVIIRCHKNTPKELFQEISNIISKSRNIIGLYGDEAAIQALLNCGIPLEEARNYGIVGCVGLSTSGLSFDNTGAIFLNLPKALELALGTENTLLSKSISNKTGIDRYSSIEDILASFKSKLKKVMEMAIIAANSYQQAHIELKPTPLMTLCIRDCFEAGIDVNKGSAKYNFSGIHLTGFADVVDSIAAIDHAVFTNQVVDIPSLISAIKKNFRGNKELRSYLLNKCPKYGCDNEKADFYASKLASVIHEAVQGFKCARGGEYRIGVHAMTTNVGFGIFTGALPSGRKKGEPLIKDVAPGTSKGEGLTATINSITKVNHSIFSNGLACTLNIDPEIAELDDGKILSTLIKTYFDRGGLHIQFNAISADTLLEAQNSPELYRDLMVRVSGYSARFNDLPRAVQEDIISRFCYRTVKSC